MFYIKIIIIKIIAKTGIEPKKSVPEQKLLNYLELKSKSKP